MGTSNKNTDSLNHNAGSTGSSSSSSSSSCQLLAAVRGSNYLWRVDATTGSQVSAEQGGGITCMTVVCGSTAAHTVC